jgi:2,5-dihydroxypyridine 5,6-dioxygenase
MFADRIEGKWIDAFCEVFERCAVKRGDVAAILSETQSRPLNVQLAELALLRLGARPFHIVLPTPRNIHPVRCPDRRERGDRRPAPRSVRSGGGLRVDRTIEGQMQCLRRPRSRRLARASR